MGLKDKLKYKFNNFMVQNPTSQITGVFVLVLLIIGLSTIFSFILLSNENLPSGMSPGILSRIWWSFMRVIDPGTITGDVGAGWALGISFFATIGGILVFSILVGFLSNKITDKLIELKKGRSLVAEKKHIVILGWSERIFVILEELIKANENKRNNRIVILSPIDSTLMYDQIKERINGFKSTKIICRTGDIKSILDLNIVSPGTARSIIILSDLSSKNDSGVLKTILALQYNNIKDIPIIAEILDAESLSLAHIVFGDYVFLIPVYDMISRFMVQVVRQDGLSYVYSEIMSFNGSEMYIQKQSNIEGKSFKDILFSYKGGIPIGIERSGKAILNPVDSELFRTDDRVILFSEDNESFSFTNKKIPINQDLIETRPSNEIKKEKTVILGWSPLLPIIIQTTDEFAPKGSSLLIVTDIGKALTVTENDIKDLNLKNIKVSYRKSTYNSIKKLKKLKVEGYDNIILVNNHFDNNSTSEEKDAQTLINLLLLRKYLDDLDVDVNITTEMEYPHNQYLAERAKVNDFIISSKIVSMILAQISQEPIMYDIYQDLFSATGRELYLKDASEYVKLNSDMNFATVMYAAYKKHHIALGYMSINENGDHSLVLNPERTSICSFKEGDRFVVIAEE